LSQNTAREEMSYRRRKAASILQTRHKVEASGFTYEKKGTMIFFGYETGCCRGTTSNWQRKEKKKNYLAPPQVQNPLLYPPRHTWQWFNPL